MADERREASVDDWLAASAAFLGRRRDASEVILLASEMARASARYRNFYEPESRRSTDLKARHILGATRQAGEKFATALRDLRANRPLADRVGQAFPVVPEDDQQDEDHEKRLAEAIRRIEILGRLETDVADLLSATKSVERSFDRGSTNRPLTRYYADRGEPGMSASDRLIGTDLPPIFRQVFSQELTISTQMEHGAWVPSGEGFRFLRWATDRVGVVTQQGNRYSDDGLVTCFKRGKGKHQGSTR